MDFIDACNVCGKKGQLFRCSKCKEAKYCSRDHQVEDWKTHKTVCGNAKQMAVVEKTAKSVEQILAAGGGTKTRKLAIPLDQISICGNHAKGDMEEQVHPLNNMAGKHRIDAPIDEETDLEDFAALGEPWELTKKKEEGRFESGFGNGIKPSESCKLKRVVGPLGLGMMIRGDVLVGKIQESDEEVTVTFDGSDSFRYDVTTTLCIGEHMIAEPGSWIDGYSIIHGPLSYHGISLAVDGGVHYNGCAFSHDGSDAPENPYYREECIDYLLMQQEEAKK